MTSGILPTLRSQLTVLYITSTIAVFLLLSVLFSGLLWIALHKQIDHHIHTVTTQAKQVINNFDGNQKEMLLDNFVQVDGMSVLIVTSDGEVLLEKKSPEIPSLDNGGVQRILAESERTGQHPIHFTIDDQRFGSASVTVNGKPALLVVGYSTKILKDTFYQIAGIVVGVIIFTLPLLAYFGYQQLKKYLHPLEAIAETAQEITHPQKLSRRVTGSPLTMEISTIITSFNGMLGRLEAIFANEHEFFSDAAHTLKTPLAVLRAKVEGLNKESESKKQEIIDVIDSAVDTVQDLLLISRIETGVSGSRDEIDISSIANELVELAEDLAQEKSVKVSSDIQPDIHFTADKRLIKKAFGNVVHNSVQYVDKQGVVHISLKEHKGKIVFSVLNSGDEITGTEVTRVFDRFYRGSHSQQKGEGSGLGLSITKTIIESYKGKVVFEKVNDDTIKVAITLAI